MKTQLEVLIVDDNQVNLIAISQILNGYGIQTDITESPGEAIVLVQNKQYDMILIDFYIPSMSGIDLLHLIQEHNLQKDVPVIAVSGSDLSEHRDELYRAGFTRILKKPVSEQSIKECLINCIDPEKRYLIQKKQIPQTDYYARLLRLTISQVRHFTDELSEHLENREYTVIQNQCHALIGPLGYLSETALSSAAGKYAKMPDKEELSAGNYMYLIQYMKELQMFKNALSKRFTELEQAMNAYNNSSNNDTVISYGQTVDAEQIIYAIKEIKMNITRFEYIEIMKKLNELRGLLHGNEQTFVIQATERMEEFDYDSAYSILDELEKTYTSR